MSNFCTNKVIMSRCLDYCLDKSVPLWKKLKKLVLILIFKKRQKHNIVQMQQRHLTPINLFLFSILFLEYLSQKEEIRGDGGHPKKWAASHHINKESFKGSFDQWKTHWIKYVQWLFFFVLVTSASALLHF